MRIIATLFLLLASPPDPAEIAKSVYRIDVPGKGPVSGLLITGDGLLLTLSQPDFCGGCEFTVSDAAPKPKTWKAKVVSIGGDFTMLKMEGRFDAPAVIGDSDAVAQGTKVRAVGFAPPKPMRRTLDTTVTDVHQQIHHPDSGEVVLDDAMIVESYDASLGVSPVFADGRLVGFLAGWASERDGDGAQHGFILPAKAARAYLDARGVPYLGSKKPAPPKKPPPTRSF